LILGPERLGLVPQAPQATLDLSDVIHPFSQMFINPQLSVSHGLSLFFLATFAMGEQTGKPRWYVIAAGIGVVHGFSRPYDLILLSGVIPLFVVMERIVTGRFSWRTTALRCVPFIAAVPALVYYLYLFGYHPVFKYWASQGEVKEIGVLWHLFSFGLAGALCLARLCLARRYPLASSAERLLVVWIAAVLILFHAHKLPWFDFMPYTPVFGLTLASVMLVLGSPILSQLETFAKEHSYAAGMGLVAALVLMNSLGSAIWVAKTCRNLARLPDHYFPSAERDAFAWLAEHADESDVVLSSLGSGNRMARYVSSRFVLGHWSVTPRVRELSKEVERLYGGELTDRESASLLDDLRVKWIYLGPLEGKTRSQDWLRLPGVAERYSQDGVRVFSYQAGPQQ
jgi:hypothetical protein